MALDGTELILGGANSFARRMGEIDAQERADKERNRVLDPWSVEAGMGQGQQQQQLGGAPGQDQMQDPWIQAMLRGEVSPQYAATAKKMNVGYHPDHAEFQGPMNAPPAGGPAGPQTEQESLARPYPYANAQPQPGAPTPQESMAQYTYAGGPQPAPSLSAPGAAPQAPQRPKVTVQMAADANNLTGLRQPVQHGPTSQDRMNELLIKEFGKDKRQGVSEGGKDTRLGTTEGGKNTRQENQINYNIDNEQKNRDAAWRRAMLAARTAETIAKGKGATSIEIATAKIQAGREASRLRAQAAGWMSDAFAMDNPEMKNRLKTLADENTKLADSIEKNLEKIHTNPFTYNTESKTTTGPAVGKKNLEDSWQSSKTGQ